MGVTVPSGSGVQELGVGIMAPSVFIFGLASGSTKLLHTSSKTHLLLERRQSFFCCKNLLSHVGRIAFL